jgi:hypothetical protein
MNYCHDLGKYLLSSSQKLISNFRWNRYNSETFIKGDKGPGKDLLASSLFKYVGNKLCYISAVLEFI